MDTFALKALHLLLGEHSPSHLEAHFESVRDAFFDKQNGTINSLLLHVEVAGESAVELHQLRFLAGHCISQSRWTEFLVALTWIDTWNGQTLVGKGLRGRLDAIRYGKYANPTLLATIQKIMNEAKEVKKDKLSKASQEIEGILSLKGIGLQSFGAFIARAGMSFGTMQIFLALKPNETFHLEFGDVLKNFETEYRDALSSRGVKFAFELWGTNGFFKRHNLAQTREYLAALHKYLPAFGLELDEEFRSIEPGDDLGFELFLSKVARSHKALVEDPKVQAVKMKSEAEELRIKALREFYQSENAIRFNGRYDIEDKNPTQDI